MEDTIIAIDPGSTISGLSIIHNGQISHAENINNVDLLKRIKQHCGNGCKVIVEDIKPYSLRLSQDVINTCKSIGVLVHELERARIKPEMVSRSEVKQWIFDTYPFIALQLIEKKIIIAHQRSIKAGKKGLISKDGTMRKPSHVWVDDRIIISCMKLRWDIETPKPGKTNRYGINKHAWQALAAGTMYLSNKKK